MRRSTDEECEKDICFFVRGLKEDGEVFDLEDFEDAVLK